MSDLCPACDHPKHYGRVMCGFAGSHPAMPGTTIICNCADHDARKADAGKARFDLIPPEPILELAEIYTYGAEKYAEDSWRQVPANKYEAALHRHLNAWKRGQDVDEESGFRHLAHALWNVVALMELTRGGKT